LDWIIKCGTEQCIRRDLFTEKIKKKRSPRLKHTKILCNFILYSQTGRT